MFLRYFGFLFSVGLFFHCSSLIANSSTSRERRVKTICAMSTVAGESLERFERDIVLATDLVSSVDKLSQLYDKLTERGVLSPSSIEAHPVSNKRLSVKLSRLGERDPRAILETWANQRVESVPQNKDAAILYIETISDRLMKGVKKYNRIVFDEADLNKKAFKVDHAIDYYLLVVELVKVVRFKMRQDLSGIPEISTSNKDLSDKYLGVLERVTALRQRALNNLYEFHGKSLKLSGEHISKADLKWALDRITLDSKDEILEDIQSKISSAENYLEAYLLTERSLELIYKLKTAYQNSLKAEESAERTRIALQEPSLFWKESVMDIRIELIRAMGSQGLTHSASSEGLGNANVSLSQVQQFINSLQVLRTYSISEFTKRDLDEARVDDLYSNILLLLGRNPIREEIFSDSNIKDDLARFPDTIVDLMSDKLETFTSLGF